MIPYMISEQFWSSLGELAGDVIDSKHNNDVQKHDFMREIMRKRSKPVNDVIVFVLVQRKRRIIALNILLYFQIKLFRKILKSLQLNSEII